MGKRRRLLIVIIFIMMFTSTLIHTYAYNLNAPHNVNQEVDVDKTKATIWKGLRGVGYSEHATAGIMGNMEAESGFNYTRIQSGKDWGAWIGGASKEANETGLGLVQWSHIANKERLFAKADEMGKQWTDLDVQIASLIDELEQGSWWNPTQGNDQCQSLDEFKNLKDYNKAAMVFVNGYEKPSVNYAHYERRKESAASIFKEFSGTSVEGGSTSAGESLGSIKNIVDEWSLIGMPQKSGFMKDMETVELPDRSSLSVKEQYSMQTIKDNIIIDEQYSTIDFIRRTVVFIGLGVLVYMVILMVSYMWDLTNVFFEVSLLKVFSLGMLQPVKVEEQVGQKGYVNNTKMAKIGVSSIAVSLIIISGGVYVWMSDIYSMILGILG